MSFKHIKGVPEPGVAGTRNQELVFSELSSPRQHTQCCTAHCKQGTFSASAHGRHPSPSSVQTLVGTLRREKAASSTQQLLPSFSRHWLPPFPGTWCTAAAVPKQNSLCQCSWAGTQITWLQLSTHTAQTWFSLTLQHLQSKFFSAVFRQSL